MIVWSGCWRTRAGDQPTTAGLACTRWLVWSTADRAAGSWSRYLQPRQGRGYGCRKDENPHLPEARVRIVAEPLEAYVEGYVIDQWRNPRAIKIAQSDDDRMKRISEDQPTRCAQLQEQKNEALRMKLRGEVDRQDVPRGDGGDRRGT